MKRFMSVLLVALFTVGILYGCSKPAPKDDAGAAVQEQTTETTVAPVDINNVKK